MGSSQDDKDRCEDDGRYEGWVVLVKVQFPVFTVFLGHFMTENLGSRLKTPREEQADVENKVCYQGERPESIED